MVQESAANGNLAHSVKIGRCENGHMTRQVTRSDAAGCQLHGLERTLFSFRFFSFRYSLFPLRISNYRSAINQPTHPPSAVPSAASSHPHPHAHSVSPASPAQRRSNVVPLCITAKLYPPWRASTTATQHPMPAAAVVVALSVASWPLACHSTATRLLLLAD